MAGHGGGGDGNAHRPSARPDRPRVPADRWRHGGTRTVPAGVARRWERQRHAAYSARDHDIVAACGGHHVAAGPVAGCGPAATLAVEVALLPVAAMTFNRITAAGLPLNLLAVPLMAVTQVAGMVTVAADTLGLPASIPGSVARLAAQSLVDTARAEWTWRRGSWCACPPPPRGLAGAVLPRVPGGWRPRVDPAPRQRHDAVRGHAGAGGGRGTASRRHARRHPSRRPGVCRVGERAVTLPGRDDRLRRYVAGP